ncbi:MAG: hypothetical protein WDO24_18090 [Pseudomonadota bacterium]
MIGADTELDRQVLELIKGSADPHGAQLGRSRGRDAGDPGAGGQVGGPVGSR